MKKITHVWLTVHSVAGYLSIQRVTVKQQWWKENFSKWSAAAFLAHILQYTFKWLFHTELVGVSFRW